MTLALIPDIEKTVSRYLREHADIIALGARVVATPPADRSTPWVRVTQLDDQAVDGSRAEHLIEFMLQLDCYAGASGGKPEASTLARTVRAALAAMPGTQNGVVVTGVQFLSGAYIPDTEFEPARERYIRTVTVWAHA